LTAVKLSHMPESKCKRSPTPSTSIPSCCRAGERKCETACSGAERGGWWCPRDRRASSNNSRRWSVSTRCCRKSTSF